MVILRYLIQLAVSMILVCVVSGGAIMYEHEIGMDLLIEIKGQYSDKQLKKKESFEFSATPTVSNGNVNASDTQWLELQLSAENNDTATFSFSYIKDLLVLDVSYIFDPKSHFPGKTKAETVEASFHKYNLNVKKGSVKSYFCELPIRHELVVTSKDADQSLSLTMTMSRVRIQAFGLVKNDLFGWGQECQYDFDHTVVGNYSLKETKDKYACLNMSVGLDVAIPYNKTNAGKLIKSSTRVIFPQGMVTNSSCVTTGLQHLSMSFYDDQFLLTFTFNRTSSKDFRVYLADIGLNYTIDNDVMFPNVTANQQGKSYALKLKKSDNLYSFSHGEYFKCLSNKTYDLTDGEGNNATLFTANLRYIAFNDVSKDPLLYGQNYEQCPADAKVSNVVPIAVGAALGLLVLIVLIAYLIGRRKTHKGYESV